MFKIFYILTIFGNYLVQGQLYDNYNYNYCPIARSPIKIEILSTLEEKIFHLLSKNVYQIKCQNAKEKITNYLMDYNSTSLYIKKSGNSIFSNPFAIFLMIYRFIYDIQEISELIKPDHDIKSMVFKNPQIGRWPDHRELYFGIDSLLRLHFHYDLKFHNYSNAKNSKENEKFKLGPEFQLKAKHCHVIGERSYNHTHFALAVEWLEHALFLMEKENSYNLPEKARLLETYKSAVFQDPKIKKLLKCRSMPNIHPYFLIQPLKIEIVSSNPQVFLIHDAVTHSVADKIIEKASKIGFQYSGHGSPQSINSQRPPKSWGSVLTETPAPYLVEQNEDSQRSFIYNRIKDEQDCELKKISKKFDMISGLKVFGNSEDMMVTGFSFGSHYNLHHDLLSDVEQGGATAFPFASFASIEPKKGAALYWINSFRNGLGDQRLVHGDCPIISGVKWVATKWAYANEQFLRVPCSLNKDE